MKNDKLKKHNIAVILSSIFFFLAMVINSKYGTSENRYYLIGLIGVSVILWIYFLVKYSQELRKK